MTHSTSLKFGRALLAALALGFAATSAVLASDTRYYVNDHLATTVGITDAAGEIAALEADAFGFPLAGAGNADRFTGKPYDEDLGAYVFPFRNYRADEARWMSADPSGFPDGVNGRFYIGVYANFIDPLGLAGWLTIHSRSDGTSSSSLSGHSWVSYTPDPTASNVNPSTTTYGTWGNNPPDPQTGQSLANGLHTNLEQGGQGNFTRTRWISDEAEKRLQSTIKNYQSRGTGAWSYLGPCSTFAADAWNSATGESLSPGLISTPSSLSDSIFKENGNTNHGSGLDVRE